MLQKDIKITGESKTREILREGEGYRTRQRKLKKRKRRLQERGKKKDRQEERGK